MKDFVMLGAQVMVNDKCSVNTTTARSTSQNLIGISELAREAGGVVTNVKPTAKQLELRGVLKIPQNSSLSLLEIIAEYDRAWNEENRLVRFVRDYRMIFEPSATTGFVASGGFSDLAFNAVKYQIGNGSVSADYTHGSGAGILTGDIPTIDLSAQAETGSLGFFVYIPEATYLTSIDIKIGSSSSDYWSETVTGNYENRGFDSGWNFIAVKWDDNTATTGTPSAASIDYVQLSFNFTQDDVDGVLFGGAMWCNENETRNYPVYKIYADKDDEHHNVTRTPYTLFLLAYKGLSFSTFAETAAEVVANESSEFFVADFGGSFFPKPIINMTINSGASSIQTIRLTNLKNDEYVELDETFTDSDIVKIDTEALSVQKNGAIIDFDGVFPNFALGQNRLALTMPSTGAMTESNSTGTTDLTGTATTDRFAQSFTAGITGNITEIGLWGRSTESGFIGRAGLPPYYDAYTVEIRTDSSGSPSSTVLWSGNIAIILSGTPQLNLRSNISVPVTNGQLYWIVLTPYKAYGGGAFVVATLQYSTANPYADGKARQSTNSGTSYSDVAASANSDFRFTTTVDAGTPNIDVVVAYKKRYL